LLFYAFVSTWGQCVPTTRGARHAKAVSCKTKTETCCSKEENNSFDETKNQPKEYKAETFAFAQSTRDDTGHANANRVTVV
jgi:hypothetical protein